jgi:hypothetical protein
VTNFTVSWLVRPALGLAVAITLAQFGTASDSTAELTIPAILLLAVIGLILGARTEERMDLRWPVGAALAVFLVYAAPIVASGEATWAGIVKLDDTATWLALSDHVFEYGTGVGDLPPSTHEATIASYLSGSYPIGSLVLMEIASVMVGEDVAWTFQPTMALWGGLLALLIFELTRPIVRGAPAAALIAVIGAMSSTLLGYYLWGGVKEMAAAALIALGPALIARADRAGWPAAALVPLAVSSAALIAVLGPGGAAWLAPTLLPGLLLVRKAVGSARFWRMAGLPVGIAAVLALLTILIAPSGVFDATNPILTAGSELGNLTGPLNLLHVAGLWPALDFRSDPHLEPAVTVLAVLVLILAAGAVFASARERAGVPFAAYVGGAAVGAALIMVVGSPWVDGKAMTMASPAVLSGGIAAVVLTWQRTGLRLEAGVAGAVIVVVAAWSAFLAYHGVALAPRDSHEELEKIADRFEGDGPTLITEVSTYGARHFLRKLDAEGATDLRRRQVLLTGGRESGDDQGVDIDQIQYDQLAPYNTIVQRTGPQGSRPPADFALAYSGTYYNVWRRQPNGLGTPTQRLPLGNFGQAGGEPACEEVAGLAAKAGPGGTLLAARASAPFLVNVEDAAKPSDWQVLSDTMVRPVGSGELTGSIEVPEAGEYVIWLGGALYGRAAVSVDGREVASEGGLIDPYAQRPIGTVDLSAGTHTVGLRYTGGGIAPGSGTESFSFGPLTFEPPRSDLGTTTVPASDYQELCGKRWDWIEAYGRSVPGPTG